MTAPPVPRTSAATFPSSNSKKPVDIAGAGLIGLSIALELRRRGFTVTVWETGMAMRQASFAAAGMLAVEDPHNPPDLLELAQYSLGLFPPFLAHVEALSGTTVAMQTCVTVQHLANGKTQRLREESLDPQELAEALLAAIRSSDIDVRENCGPGVPERVADRTLVVAAGAWSGHAVTPRKGQMLRVKLPLALRGLTEVHRSDEVYIVPRTHGLQAGTALIGATVEDAGFDTETHMADLEHLRRRAADLLPALASTEDAPLVEAWAGLRPATPDGLPLVGWSGEGIVATGHFRNGILLAPATAAIVADLIEGHKPAVDIEPFMPCRFESQSNR